MYTTFLNNDIPKNDFFLDPDTEILFKRNIKKQPSNWIYRNKNIKYENNELNFRTKSFNKINWNDSIVIFGCSIVYGIGLAEEDTLCYILEKKLNRPVINLGIIGSSIELNHYNSMILHENFPHPKAIIHCWSFINRYVDFKRKNKKDEVINCVPMYSHYKPGINWAKKSKMQVYADRIIWKNKTIYKEYSFFEETWNDLKITPMSWIDFARDLSHPGIESNLIAAEKIYADIKDKL